MTVFIEPFHQPLDHHRTTQSVKQMLVIFLWHAEDDHGAIAHVFVDGASVKAGGGGDSIKVDVEHVGDGIRRQVFGQPGEADDIREDHGGGNVTASQLYLIQVGHHVAGHGGADEALQYPFHLVFLQHAVGHGVVGLD